MAEAELKLDTNVQITLVPMLIQPGDTVLIPVERASRRWLDEMSQAMTRDFPEVTFCFIEGSPMRHALVYRPTGDRLEGRRVNRMDATGGD